MNKDRKGLGRGLSALMGDFNIDSPTVSSDTVVQPAPDEFLSISKIRPNPDQPRRDFNEAALLELANSIRVKGVIQPIIVRYLKALDKYEIVAGERRWRAAQMADLSEIPAIIRDLSDDDVLEIAIIENIQRENLNPLEEALGFRQLMDRFGHTQEKLAAGLSKSRSHIANTLRLLSLPDRIQNMLRAGQISAGHARSLIGAENAEGIAEEIVKKGLTVRDVESMLRAEKGGAGKPKAQVKPTENKDLDTRAIEADLSENLSMLVSINHNSHDDGGEVRISYKNLDQLDKICQLLSSM